MYYQNFLSENTTEKIEYFKGIEIVFQIIRDWRLSRICAMLVNRIIRGVNAQQEVMYAAG
jgi:hypothetical protein